jgi:hypothetical protein
MCPCAMFCINVIVFPKPARQNFTSQAEFCKPKLLPWQSGEVCSRAKSDSRIPACLYATLNAPKRKEQISVILVCLYTCDFACDLVNNLLPKVSSNFIIIDFS